MTESPLFDEDHKQWRGFCRHSYRDASDKRLLLCRRDDNVRELSGGASGPELLWTLRAPCVREPVPLMSGSLVKCSKREELPEKVEPAGYVLGDYNFSDATRKS